MLSVMTMIVGLVVPCDEVAYSVYQKGSSVVVQVQAVVLRAPIQKAVWQPLRAFRGLTRFTSRRVTPVRTVASFAATRVERFRERLRSRSPFSRMARGIGRIFPFHGHRRR